MEFNASSTRSYEILANVTSVLYSNQTIRKVHKQLHKSFPTYKTILTIFGILIILSNLTVILSSGLILKKGRKPKSTYILLGNVSAADLISGISIIANIYLDYKRPKASSKACVFLPSMMVCVQIVSIYSVALIAIDRYIFILHGMYYQRWFNTTRVRIGISLIWTLGIILAFLPITGWVNYELQETRCYYISLYPVALLILNSVICIIPIIIITILYFIILVRALRNISKIKANARTTKSDTQGKSEMRMTRGNGNLGKSPQSVNSPLKSTPNKLERSSSFNAGCHNEDESKNCTLRTEKSKSNDDFSNTKNAPSSINDVEEVKGKIQVDFDSKASISTQNTTHSDSISVIDLDEIDMNVTRNRNRTAENKVIKKVDLSKSTVQNNLKKASKSKAPNKWRAITVVTLTIGNLLITWLPFLIAVICYAICEDKLTNKSCKKIRIILGRPMATLAVLNGITNPLIYAWWHKGFKRSLKSIYRRYIYNFFVKNTN